MAEVEVDPRALLAGPRGRRVCWELLVRTGGWEWEEPPQSAGPTALADALRNAVTRSDIGALAVAREPTSFLAAPADAVTWARYWQEPDVRDWRLADRRVAEQLRPVAEAVSRAPAAHWWSSAIGLAGQHEVVFDDPPEFRRPDPPDDGRAALTAWREDTLDEERRAADRPDDVRPVGPVGLHLVEDEQGWTSARCWKLPASAHRAGRLEPGRDLVADRQPAPDRRSGQLDRHRRGGAVHVGAGRRVSERTEHRFGSRRSQQSSAAALDDAGWAEHLGGDDLAQRLAAATADASSQRRGPSRP